MAVPFGDAGRAGTVPARRACGSYASLYSQAPTIVPTTTLDKPSRRCVERQVAREEMPATNIKEAFGRSVPRIHSRQPGIDRRLTPGPKRGRMAT